MGEFTLTRRIRIWIAIWLTGLVVLTLVTILSGINDTLGAGALGAWCGIAIAAVMVSRERAKKRAPSSLERQRYGRR